MKLAVISQAQSDLENILNKYAQVTHYRPDDDFCLDNFDACAILGGTEEEPISLSIDNRLKLEAFIKTKKPVFME